jgi:hypothetical protein
MPRPTYRPATPALGLGYRARAAQRKAQARARLALQALAVALPVATVWLLWPYVEGVLQALAAALALPVVH